METTVELWDKKSPINGIKAKEILKLRPEMESNTYLLLKVGNKVIRHEDVDTIRLSNKWFDKTDEEIAELLLEDFKKKLSESEEGKITI